MADSVQTGSTSLLPALDVASNLAPRTAPNGVRFASYGQTQIADADLQRIVQAVPARIAPALADRVFYFVPLAIPETPSANPDLTPTDHDSGLTLVAPEALPELFDEAICHRNVKVAATFGTPAHEGTFISARLLRDTFALAFELFINIGHIFTDHAGVPEDFSALVWKQALADVRGETSQDAWEARTAALLPRTPSDQNRFNEKARLDFSEAAFADALAIYQLSLAVDFDYAELREREYPLLAPVALADRLRLVATLFPPNTGYTFAIRYRRRN